MTAPRPRAAPRSRADRPADEVTVVIPVLDDAALLDRCLTALSRQTLRPAEVVVVDDGSADDSTQVARRHGATVVREEVRAIAAAASRGYDAASCPLIARLDADCEPGPAWLLRAVTILRRHPDAAAVTGFATLAGLPRPLGRIGGRLYLGAYYLAAGAALGHPPVFGSDFVMQRDAWRRISGEVHREDDLLHDDLDLSVHLRAAGRILLRPGLTMAISARPFTEGGWRLRFRRAFHTLARHWPAELPWRRWWRTWSGAWDPSRSGGERQPARTPR